MKSLQLVALLLLASAPIAAQDTPAAQQPTDFKGVVLKNKAPVSNDVLRVAARYLQTTNRVVVHTTPAAN